MAENKKKNNVKGSSGGKQSNLPAPKKRAVEQHSEQRDDSRRKTPREPINNAVPEDPSSKFIHQFLPFIIGFVAVLLAAFFLCVNLFEAEGAVGVGGRWVNNVFCGLFGWPVFFLPLILFNLAIFWRKYVDMGLVPLKLIFSLLTLLAVSALIHVITVHTEGSVGFDIAALWYNAVDLSGGGVLGGILGELFYRLLNIVGSLIVLGAGIFILLMFLFGTTPRAIGLYVRYKIKRAADRRAQRAAELAEKDAEYEQIKADIASKKKDKKEARRAEREEKKEEERRRRHEILEDNSNLSPEPTVFTDNNVAVVGGTPADNADESMGTIPLGEAEDFTPMPEPEMIPLPAIDADVKPGRVAVEAMRHSSDSQLVQQLENDDDFNDLNDILAGNQPASAKKKEASSPKAVAEEEPDLGLITDVEDISELTETEDEPEAVVPTEYVFPPYELLAQPTESEEDFAQELRDNAKRLMDTLKSFNVRIKEINYSRGPTITRYELRPDDGVRIRTIANLVDDIALGLATAGVRIEAPIPGKSAVGIEVPNQHQATVFLRKLIESQTFHDNPSRLAVCLGEDVAGKAI